MISKHFAIRPAWLALAAGWKTILLAGLLLAALSACAQVQEPQAPGSPTEVPASTPAGGEQPAATTFWKVRPIGTPPPGAEFAPAPADPTLGEVPPELLSVVLDDAAGRAGVELEAIQVLRAEAVTWSDGSLGCPRMGEEYLQVLTPGYWVELQVGAEKFDYRLSEGGYMRLCETALPQKP